MVSGVEIYSVDGVISTVEKSITSKFDNQNIFITGIYFKDGTKDYNGYYYDHLRDVNSSIFITLRIPIKIRDRLDDKSICVLKGFIVYKVRRNGDCDTNINIYFSVDELIREEEKQIDRTIEKYYELLGKKQSKVDINNIIKNKLLNTKIVETALIMGSTAIVDKDIFSALGEYAQYYKFYQYKVNLKPDEIIKQLEYLKDTELDFIVITRGGGTGLEVFNNLNLLEYIVNYPIPIVTAIGHKEDNTYFSKLSDLDCATPTALGTFLKTSVEEYFNNLNELRKKNIDLIRKDLEKQYTERLNELVKQNKIQTDNLVKEKDKQLKNIIDEKDKQVKLINEERNRQSLVFNKQIDDLKKEFELYKIELNKNKDYSNKLQKDFSDKEKQFYNKEKQLIDEKNIIKQEILKINHKNKIVNISSIAILTIVIILIIIFI